MTQTVEIVVLDPRLREWGLPRYQSASAAAIDLHACLDDTLTLEPGAASVLIPAGFAMHIADPGLAGLIVPRSGAGHRRGLALGNTVGVIDADYTGPILLSIWNRGFDALVIVPGERIAQLLFVPIARATLAEVAAFSLETERGAGGFGSTGL